jgi:hypothetical protein
MMVKPERIVIDDVTYVREDAQVGATSKDAVIVRCQAAGCFFGQLVASDLGKGYVKLSKARRLWYWSGAASLSQLAVDGTSKPNDCKFPVAVPEIEVTGVLEVIPCTAKAIESINAVAIWKA